MAAHDKDSLSQGALSPAPPAIEPRRIVPVMPAPSPPALSSSPDATALLKALRRRWLMAGALGFLAAILALVATWYLFPAKYLSSILLQVSSKQQTGLEQGNNLGPTRAVGPGAVDEHHVLNIRHSFSPCIG